MNKRQSKRETGTRLTEHKQTWFNVGQKKVIWLINHCWNQKHHKDRENMSVIDEDRVGIFRYIMYLNTKYALKIKIKIKIRNSRLSNCIFN